MDRKAVKELLHIKGWLDRVDLSRPSVGRTPTWATTCSRRPATP